MWGVPRRLEIMRYRGLWYRWGKADKFGELVHADPARRLKQRVRESAAVARAAKRAQVPVPHSVRDLHGGLR